MPATNAAGSVTTAPDPSRARSLRRWQVHVNPHRAAIAVLLLLAMAFYMWTADSTFTFTFPSSSPDFYNELTTGFLHGHTYLDLTPPPGLLRLADPYDPVQNAVYRQFYQDLVLPRALLLPVGADAGPDAFRAVPDHRASDV